MKRILIIFCAVISVHTGYAFQKNKDSVKIAGSFLWKDTSIKGYPSKVKIISLETKADPIFHSVDSLGKFSFHLTKGKYSIKSELNYYWMGEELIRIDEKKSTITREINSDQTIKILLDTIGWPNRSFEKGVLVSEKIDFKKIDEFMKERMEFFEIPGATLSLIKDNKVIYSQIYGVTNANTQQPVTSQTLFEAGSITKLVFAFAVMRLYERGEIDLDKPIYKYMPLEEYFEDERYKLLTPRIILSHQSGLSNWPRKNENGKYPFRFTPGEKYGYSGRAFEFLKMTLESITSKPIETILKEEVLEPLQISDMYFKGNEMIEKYGSNGHKKYIPSPIFMAKRTMVAYTLQTKSEALAKFAIALSEKKGLKKETYNEMLKIHSQREDGTRWGLGVRIEDSPLGVNYGHSGSTGRGFIGNLVYYKNGVGYTVITNAQMGGYLSLPLLNEFLITGGK